MARQRRQDQVELSFDGLTDSVTNLVGTLILLVVLVMSVTRDKPTAAPQSAAAESAGESAADLLSRVEVLRAQVGRVGAQAAEVAAEAVQWRERASQIPDPPASADDARLMPQRRRLAPHVGAFPVGLMRQGLRGLATAWLAGDSAAGKSRESGAAELLRARMASARRELDDTQKQVDKLREELRELTRKLAEAPATPPPPDETLQVRFRPPLERVSNKRPLFLVCENGRVSVLVDFDTLVSRIKTARQVEGPQTLKLPGDFDLRGEVFPPDKLKLFAERHPGAEGETADQAAQPNARWRRFLEEHSPRKYNVQFNVYPDSHDIFRQVRAVCWQAGFEVGWNPQRSGSQVVLTPGNSKVQ